MIPNVQSEDAKWVVETYFSNPERKISIKKGEVLLKEDQINNRLFLVLDGKFSGSVTDDKGNQQEAFRTFPGKYIGLHSFFSGSFTSIATVRAMSDSEVVFMERHDPVVPYKGRLTLEEQFMPIVVFGLVNRQQSELNLFKEKEATYKKLIEHEKQASLGKMAAGIAHELNNAVAVLFSSANWLIEKIAHTWQDQKETAIFEAGLLSGRHLSSREKRELQKMWQSKHSLSSTAAKALAQTGLPEQTLLRLNNNLEKSSERLNMLWEIGASLNDMRTASQHAKHVVKSVKLLGAKSTDRERLNINESIENALALLSTKVKTVNLEADLGQLPVFSANMGEMVQVWLNLTKNAIEALNSAKSADPKINVKSYGDTKKIYVEISDNGPGIPSELQKAIFEPDVTTKKTGMSFGLGLGLAIVKRIVSSYNGKVKLTSSESGSTFKISLPLEH
ncbi:MAG: GHKL domain-containing protein [Calditrichaeota bacterium]|nr:MAG: GHKL domain-containing protein [Calditrichota bacterium]MBL1205076.1 GHKL domain-containing protein [Calditrichota bacterium]NOG44906.1 cyclic nucleotide-binding domain-containing protein [Calditrichota bacterium]